MADQEPVTEKVAKLETSSSLQRFAHFRSRRVVAGLVVLLLVAVFGFYTQPKTDEDRFDEMRRARKWSGNLHSSKWRWLDRSYEFVHGRPLSDELFSRSIDYHRQLEGSGYLTNVAIPLLQVSDMQQYSILWQTVISKIETQAAKGNLYFMVYHVSPDTNVSLSCRKEDAPGWMQYFSNLATNSTSTNP